jgi:hypothetical protein
VRFIQTERAIRNRAGGDVATLCVFRRNVRCSCERVTAGGGSFRKNLGEWRFRKNDCDFTSGWRFRNLDRKERLRVSEIYLCCEEIDEHETFKIIDGGNYGTATTSVNFSPPNVIGFD